MLLLAIVMVVVIMAAAAFAVMVVMLMIMVVVMVVIVVVMVVASALMVVVMLMIVIVAMAFHMLVQLVVEAGVIDRMEHPVSEFVFVDVQDRAHEREADLLHRFELSVALDSVLDIGQIEGDPLSVLIDDGGFDVSEEASRLLGDPLSDGHEGLGHPRLGIRVPSRDGSLEAFGASSGDLERGVLVLVMVVASAFAVGTVFVTHLIIS